MEGNTIKTFIFHSFLLYLYPHLAKIKSNMYKSAVFLNNVVPVINYLKKVNLTFPIQKKKKNVLITLIDLRIMNRISRM